MKRLIILGAGKCGREVLQWAKDINEVEHRWKYFAFLDYDTEALKEKNCDAEIIANDEDYDIQPDDEFVCAIGSGLLRKKLMTKMEAKGAKFVNLRHPTAIVASSAVLQKGIILYPYSIITADVNIGKGCIINMHTSVGHDVRMGEYCTISPNCHITGACTLGDNVFMGVNSSIIPSIYVGDNAYICAGSTVMTKVRADTRVMGCPAQRMSSWRKYDNSSYA